MYYIKFSSIKQWHYNLKKDQDWEPDHKRKEASYKFSIEEEAKIVTNIDIIIAEKSVPITNNLIREIMLKFYYNIKNQILNYSLVLLTNMSED